MPECLISFGSNVDDRLGNIQQAMSEMTVFFRFKKISSLYETQPVGYPHQGWFLNLVAQGEFNEDPLELMRLILEIQGKYRGEKKFKNAPRSIDVDILTFENVIITTKELTLPHPEMDKRLFVLLPLQEICPDFIHPECRLKIDELIQNCPDKSEVKLIGDLTKKMCEDI